MPVVLKIGLCRDLIDGNLTANKLFNAICALVDRHSNSATLPWLSVCSPSMRCKTDCLMMRWKIAHEERGSVRPTLNYLKFEIFYGTSLL